MPYKSSQWHNMAGGGSTSSFRRSTSPVIAHHCRSLAPRLAPHRLLVTVSRIPHGTAWRTHAQRILTVVGDTGAESQVPRCLAAHAARVADLRGPATAAAALRT